ncbi:uncharacterized protein LOC131159667 [Malania oleifera]|uniref:uncharacterized protein LOC131159667 n=1 Tax=Malania oleifera TaxID=397392 RepID=UPI0025AE188C|nr:uncharacterized protein LOC131159667 [Malania oleifera]
MAKFNVVQKQKRALLAERKRALHGDPHTGKLRNKSKTQPCSLSGKRQRKLLKKWRREQKEAVDKGLITMQDVEMTVSEGTSQDANKTPTRFHLKKNLKFKKLKHKGKNKRKSSKPAAEFSVEAMVE